jgi:hypothetical protein
MGHAVMGSGSHLIFIILPGVHLGFSYRNINEEIKGKIQEKTE